MTKQELPALPPPQLDVAQLPPPPVPPMPVSDSQQAVEVQAQDGTLGAAEHGPAQ